MKTDQTPLHDALAELATTMSANPDRLRQIRDRVDRRRRRRMATGAAVSAGAVAAAVGIAMVPREPRSALQFNVEGPSLPACASVPAGPAPQKTTAPEGATPAEPDAVVRYKGHAVITEVGTGTLTLGELATPGSLPPSDPIVVIVDASTTLETNGKSGPLVDAAVGQRVLFVVSVGDDQRLHLDYIDNRLDDADVKPVDTTAADKVDAEKKAAAVADHSDQVTDEVKAANEAPTDGVVRGKGFADAPPVNNVWVLTAYLAGVANLQSVRLVLGPDTQFFRFETACANAELVVDSSVVFAALPNGDGTYTATELRIYQ